MPIYEYQCSRCGEKFERRRSINDKDSELKCPKCGQEHPRRQFCSFGTASSSSSSGVSTPGCAPAAHT